MREPIELLKTLTDVNGIAGYEYQVKEKMRDHLTPISDETIEDGLGGIFGKRGSRTGSKSLMLAGHLDEIGFIVTEIDNNGFIKFQLIGGWWNQVVLSQKVTITTDDGKEIRSVIGSKPPHVLEPDAHKKSISIKDMFIDIGVKSKAGAEQYGIEIGNVIIPYGEFEQLANGKYLTAKAFDNRYGCALTIDVLNNLKDESIGINLYTGGTVQGEVGLRGARVATNKINPDLAIAVDVTAAYGIPGMAQYGSDTAIGGGPVITSMDASNVAHQGLRQHIKGVVKKHYITVQWDMTPRGGTDADSIHVASDGIPTVAIDVASRYMHSNASVLHTDDYGDSVRLITEIARSLNDQTYYQIKW